MAEPRWDIMAKGFLNVIKDYSDIMSEKEKIKGDILANEFKAKRNFFWQMQEKNYQTDYQKKLMQMFEQQQGGQGGIEGEGRYNINAPKVQLGTTGAEVKYPSARDKEFQIKEIWGRLDKKQANNTPLNNVEKRFMKEYPKEMWIKSEKTTEESKQFEEDIKIKLSQGENLNPEEVNYYNKFMWRTGQEMKMPKKERTKYGEFYIGQEYKGYKYIGNNQWQKQ